MGLLILYGDSFRLQVFIQCLLSYKKDNNDKLRVIYQNNLLSTVMLLHFYIRQVNGVHWRDILWCLIPSVRRSVTTMNTQYLDANISKMVWDRGLVPITH